MTIRLRASAGRVAPLTLLFIIAGAGTASAQFGGLVRRAREKVEQAAADKANEKADSAASDKTGHPTTVRRGSGGGGASSSHAAPPKSPLGPYVEEFTPDMLDRAFVALDAEQRQAARHKRLEAERLQSQHNTEMDAYQACFMKAVSEYSGNQAKIAKKCGTIEQAQAKRAAWEQGRKDREAADSAALRVAAFVNPDSAGAVAGGFGSERSWGTVKERITAFLILGQDGPLAQCMKSEPNQYIFLDSERTLLSAHRDALAKRFLDRELVKDAVWGRCRKVPA